ncbi:MAG: hypothetical protein IPP38_12145 [Bacteroidetes bacterium]|nr:hypothetical protein [Bacteroidota bacterium]
MKSILKAVHIFILMIYFSPTLLAQTPSWLWANSAGGGIVYDIATDSYGNVYATGYYTDSIMSFGTLSIASEGEDEGFIAKYDPSEIYFGQNHLEGKIRTEEPVLQQII